MDFSKIAEKFKQNFITELSSNFVTYILQFLVYVVLFYLIFKVLKNNKVNYITAIICFFVVGAGLAFGLSNEINSEILIMILALIGIIVFTMFNIEIKRNMLDSKVKKRSRDEAMTASGIQLIIDEIVHAVQNMSKNNIGALIVLSDDNLPEGIVESGTIINAQITSQMIEAVFYPKAPLHDGALIVEGSKLYAAGCFLPLAQNDMLPKEMGSRHRAALGVTMAARVSVIVVSEETGVISIVKNGAVRKKYADASDIKDTLNEYYWTDITAESQK